MPSSGNFAPGRVPKFARSPEKLATGLVIQVTPPNLLNAPENAPQNALTLNQRSCASSTALSRICTKASTACLYCACMRTYACVSCKNSPREHLSSTLQMRESVAHLSCRALHFAAAQAGSKCSGGFRLWPPCLTCCSVQKPLTQQLRSAKSHRRPDKSSHQHAAADAALRRSAPHAPAV